MKNESYEFTLTTLSGANFREIKTSRDAIKSRRCETHVQQ